MQGASLANANCSTCHTHPPTPTHPTQAAAAILRRLAPLGDRVLVKRVVAEARTASGIILPDSGKKLNEGEIVAVGPGAITRDGKVLPMNVKVRTAAAARVRLERGHRGEAPSLNTPPPSHSHSLAHHPDSHLCRRATRCCCQSTAATRSRLVRMSSTSTGKRTSWASLR